MLDLLKISYAVAAILIVAWLWDKTDFVVAILAGIAVWAFGHFLFNEVLDRA